MHTIYLKVKSCKDFLCETPGFIRGQSKSTLKRTPEVFPGNNITPLIKGNSSGVFVLMATLSPE
jgi:hypothetical protein